MYATLTTADILTAPVRTMIRAAAGLSGTPYPIVLADTESAPRLVGRSYYWTTPSGRTEVRHPNAYGWPTKYHGSTRRIEVGAGWLRAHAPAVAARLDAGAGI